MRVYICPGVYVDEGTLLDLFGEAWADRNYTELRRIDAGILGYSVFFDRLESEEVTL